MTGETAAEAATHEASLAVWAIPEAVAGGARFAVKAGAKSSAGCALAGCTIAIVDDAGATIATGRLGDTPWPGTDALHWCEIELTAPARLGGARLAARFDGAAAAEPHVGAETRFSITVVAPPAHRLTVRVAVGGAPLPEAYVRLGPHRAVTDAAGRAELMLAAGQYRLQVWKAGYDAPDLPLDIAADAFVEVAALPQPEDDPDARWTA
jgi:hypothetical protein